MAKVTIAGARVTKGWSQQEFADRLGVSRSAVQKWESGKSQIKISNLRAIADLTGFDLNDFLLPEKYA